MLLFSGLHTPTKHYKFWKCISLFCFFSCLRGIWSVACEFHRKVTAAIAAAAAAGCSVEQKDANRRSLAQRSCCLSAPIQTRYRDTFLFSFVTNEARDYESSLIITLTRSTNILFIQEIMAISSHMSRLGIFAKKYSHFCGKISLPRILSKIKGRLKRCRLWLILKKKTLALSLWECVWKI